MKHNILFAAFAVTMLTACGGNEQIRVACVGDSITEGHGIKIQSRDDYPVVLNRILGDGYSVQNCGKSGTTVQKDADYPYWICKEFSNAVALNADIVVIKLGTNDTKPQNWNAERFKADYQSLIDTLKTNGAQDSSGRDGFFRELAERTPMCCHDIPGGEIAGS